MTQKLKKDDIRSGYLVKLRDKSFRIVIRAGSFTKILIAEDGAWNYLGSGWDADLKASNTYKNCHLEGILQEPVHDIVAVYGLMHGTDHYDMQRWKGNMAADIRHAIFDCCDMPGEVTQAQIDHAYTGRISCPHCGCWSTLTLLGIEDAPGQDCRISDL